MYAVVKTGGKQYRVAKDDKILVEHIDAEAGETITLDKVMMLGDGDNVTIGTPVVENATVEAEVVRQTRGPKIVIFRRTRRKNHRRLQGHRQDLTLLRIKDISEQGSKAAPKAAAKKAAKAAPKAETAEKPAAKKAAAKKPAAKKAAAKKKAD